MKRREMPFGTQVLVRAQTIRVIAQTVDDKPAFKQASSGREYGRYLRPPISGPAWPGTAIPLEWEPATKTFEASPAVDDVYARLRRLAFNVPEVGLVVGHTRRTEGTVQAGDNEEAAHLSGPGRTINLYEVALNPGSSRKARIILAHHRDLQTIR